MRNPWWAYALVAGLVILTAAINVNTINTIVDQKIQMHDERTARAASPIERPRTAEKTVVISPAQAAADAAFCREMAAFINTAEKLG